MAGQPPQAATALCRFCFVALCKDHLMELYRQPRTFPPVACQHTPARAPASPAGRRANATPTPEPAPAPAPTPSPTESTAPPVRPPAPRLAPGFGTS
jgi:hypothetical protein